MPQPTALARLTTHGPRIYCDGQPWFGKGASFFIGYERFLNGEDLRPQLEQLAALGANCVDVWASYWHIATNKGRDPFHLGLRPDGFDRLPDFHALLAEYGLYAIWVAFCDARLFDWPLAREQDFWHRFNAVLDPIDNVATIILNNEHNAHRFNEVQRDRFDEPPRHIGVCSSFIAMKSSEFPRTPRWKAGALHQSRSYSKMIKDASTVDHPFQEDLDTAIPVWLDEPLNISQARAHEQAQDPRLIEQMVLTALGSACGVVMHSENGKQAELLDAYTLERAVPAFRAMR